MKYFFYFGNKSPSELKRPVLGGQLETMRKWVSSLKGSPPGSGLAKAGTDLEAAIVVADAAAAALSKAEQDNREFRTTGARRALFDTLNAVRKATEGKVAEMPHAHPEWNLPTSFPDRFFGSESKKETAAPTAQDLEAQIADAEAQLASLKENLAKAKTAEEEAAKAKAEAEAHDAELAAAEKEAAAAAAKLAAIKAKKKKK